MVGSLRFTSHLSNPIAIAITSVVKVMDDFVPGVSNLIEGLSLWLLTLICGRTAEKEAAHQPLQIELEQCEFITTSGLMSSERTEGIALPPPTSLSIAGAVHHVAFVMALGKFLVHLIVHAIHNALVW